jgi:branched chain amino acid efflux pump
VTEAWIVVALVGAGTIAIKAAGPVLLGGRPLPVRLGGVIELLAPALLGALVAVQTF